MTSKRALSLSSSGRITA